MIFVDTGAFLARYLKRDQYHRRAASAWKRVRSAGLPCVTSNFVLDETFTFLARIAGFEFASGKARLIYSSESLTILRPGEEEELEALEFFARYADLRISFTDCISFALMRRNAIRQAFSYDRHFRLAGFELWPPAQ